MIFGLKNRVNGSKSKKNGVCKKLILVFYNKWFINNKFIGVVNFIPFYFY
jgi:hypothetical protein